MNKPCFLFASVLLSSAITVQAVEVIYNHLDAYKCEPSLLDIFTARSSQWQEGSKITVFIQPRATSENNEFIDSYLGIQPSRFKELLAINKASGHRMPIIKEVASDEQVLVDVSLTPNSIGYVRNLSVGSRLSNNIETVSFMCKPLNTN